MKNLAILAIVGLLVCAAAPVLYADDGADVFTDTAVGSSGGTIIVDGGA